MCSQRQLLAILGFTIVALLLTLPVIFYGLPFGHDAVFHLNWYAFFSQQLWAGEFYPRWLVGIDSGLGSPVFFYYPPVAFWFTSLLHPLFPNDPQGWHQLGISAWLALIASGIGAYIWLKRITTERAAFIAALLYMAMPYHLAVDLYERSAFPEYWSFVWMPLILYFVSRIAVGQTPAIIGLALSYGLLIMTHPPTMLAFSVVPPCYAFVAVDSSRRRRVLCITLAAMALGVGLSSIYLIPAMTTQGAVPVQILWREKYHYSKFFLVSGLFTNSNNRGVLLYLIRVHWLVIVMVCLAFTAFAMGFSRTNTIEKRERKFWLAIAVMSVFMMTPLSKPIWQLFSVLQMIQQPWRFNTVLAVATTALVGLGRFSGPLPQSIRTRKLVAITGLCLSSWVFITVWIAYHSVPFHKKSANRALQAAVELVDSEYRPRWAHRMEGDGRTQVKIVEGTGSATVLRWKPRNILLDVNASGGASLDVSQNYYPGWTAQVVGDSICLPVNPSNPEGLLHVSVPNGKHEVLLRLTESFAESIGQTISTLAALTTICLGIWLVYRRSKEAVGSLNGL